MMEAIANMLVLIGGGSGSAWIGSDRKNTQHASTVSPGWHRGTSQKLWLDEPRARD